MIGVRVGNDYRLANPLSYFEPYFFSYGKHKALFKDFKDYQIELFDGEEDLHFENPDTEEEAFRHKVMQHMNKMIKKHGVAINKTRKKYDTFACYFAEGKDKNDECFKRMSFIIDTDDRGAVYKSMLDVMKKWASEEHRVVAVSTRWHQLEKDKKSFSQPHIHVIYEKRFENDRNELQAVIREAAESF